MGANVFTGNITTSSANDTRLVAAAQNTTFSGGVTLGANQNNIFYGDGNFVETTPGGQQVAVAAGDAKSGAGSLFGLAIAPDGKGLVYVDDGLNTLRWLH